MGVLWASIGASPAYEMFAGGAEVLGGVLWLVPRTTMLGAMICLADMVQVFSLNMTYDVPVKLFSFHLILLSLFLLIPDLRRLSSFLVLNRPVGPSTQPQLFKTRRANRVALAVQVVFGLSLLAMNAYGGWKAWHTFGGGREHSALYGIWNVEESSTNALGWRRVIFDFPTRVSFQSMDDSFRGYGAAINIKDNTIALTKTDDKNWKAMLAYHRVGKDRMTLEGDFDGKKTELQVRLMDRNKFTLVNRGFHWIQEYPYNR